MGRASRHSFLKRAKEKERREKAATKRERRLARKRDEPTDGPADGDSVRPRGTMPVVHGSTDPRDPG
jgi:hypothetical protein